MKIASRATPEGLAGHGLSTTGLSTESVNYNKMGTAALSWEARNILEISLNPGCATCGPQARSGPVAEFLWGMERSRF